MKLRRKNCANFLGHPVDAFVCLTGY